MGSLFSSFWRERKRGRRTNAETQFVTRHAENANGILFWAAASFGNVVQNGPSGTQFNILTEENGDRETLSIPVDGTIHDDKAASIALRIRQVNSN